MYNVFSKLVVDDNGCWVYQGKLNHKGYARVSFQGKQHQLHRLMFDYYYEALHSNLTIDHLCRNRACCNPFHLDQVSASVNILRGFGPTAINKRKTHCMRGHEFTPENTTKNGNGRKCKQCHHVIAHRSYKKNFNDIQSKGKIYYQEHQDMMKANAKRSKLRRKLQKVTR